MNSYPSGSYQNKSIAGSESNKIEIAQVNILEEYIELLDKHEAQLISKYGEPNVKDTLYGGRIYYYERLSTAFGIDGDKISSLLLYEGKLNDDIKIGLSLDEILQNLNLTEESVQLSSEYPKHVLYDYKGHETYLIFYDELLQEILIKKWIGD